MEIDETIIKNMTLHRQLKGKTFNQIKDQVRRGLEIATEDKRLLEEKKYLRSHFHMSEWDQDSMFVASIYNIYLMDPADIIAEEE